MSLGHRPSDPSRMAIGPKAIGAGSLFCSLDGHRPTSRAPKIRVATRLELGPSKASSWGSWMAVDGSFGV